MTQPGELLAVQAVLIELTSWCNRSCTFCPNSTIEKSPDMLMPEETILRTVGELKRIGYRGRVHLYGNGEPLSDHRFFDLLPVIRKALPGNHLFISTNGDYLNRPDDLEHLRRLGLDEIHVSHYDDRNGHLANREIPGVHHFGLGVLALEFYNRGGHVNVGSVANHRSCWWAYGKMYINYRGDVCLCCSDWEGRVVWGNINREPIESIWNNEEYRNCREMHMTGRGKEFQPLCNKCNR